MNDKVPYALLIHGGAGPKPGRDYSLVRNHLKDCINLGETLLKSGSSAVDVVEQVVRELEISGLYVAGRGSGRNTAGFVELDAAIMDGKTSKAGAIAAVRDIVHPVSAARRVMDATSHILIAGQGANLFCEAQGLDRVTDPATWYMVPVGVTVEELGASELSHGTVGAVALDQSGHLAAATSTGGLFGKQPGRVGDSPLIGAGTWADSEVAVSCTGLGEDFIRTAAAHEISARLRHGQQDLQSACRAVLDEIARHGGDGGMIALRANGEFQMAYNAAGMKRASVIAGQAPEIAVFAD